MEGQILKKGRKDGRQIRGIDGIEEVSEKVMKGKLKGGNEERQERRRELKKKGKKSEGKREITGVHKQHTVNRRIYIEERKDIDPKNIEIESAQSQQLSTYVAFWHVRPSQHIEKYTGADLVVFHPRGLLTIWHTTTRKTSFIKIIIEIE